MKVTVRKVTVKLFARARDLAGAPTVDLQVGENARVADVKASLAEVCPALAPLMPRLLFAIGSDYADDAREVPIGGDVACFPPVSGG